MTTRNNRLPILPALVAWLAAALVSATAAPLPPPPVDPNAVLYVSNRSLAIQKFDAHGASLGTLNTTSTAYGLAGDSAGNIYASSNNGHVIKMYTPGGGTSIIANANTVIAGSHGFDPLGMAIDAAGNLFVANPVPNFPGEILKFTPDGQGHFTPSVFANSSSYLAQPYDLAFDSGGNLYVTNFDSNSNSIAKFTPLGAGSIFAQSANIYQPTGLAIDGSDNIFVASFNHDAIWKYGSDGSDLGAFAQDNPNSPQFLNAPIGLAFDSVGNLYAADRQSNTIEKFDQFGSHSAFAHLSLPESILIQSNLALPEPSSLVLAALGFLGLAVWGKTAKGPVAGKRRVVDQAVDLASSRHFSTYRRESPKQLQKRPQKPRFAR